VLQHPGPQLVGVEQFFMCCYRSARGPHLAQHPGPHYSLNAALHRQLILATLRPTSLQLGIKHRATTAILTCCRLACYCSCRDVIIPKFRIESRYFFIKNRTESEKSIPQTPIIVRLRHIRWNKCNLCLQKDSSQERFSFNH